MMTDLFTVALILLVLVVLLGVIFVFKVLLSNREGQYQLEEYQYVDPNTNQSNTFKGINAEPTKYISIIAPAYNEEERISVMLEETVDFLQEKQKADPSFTWEIVIVDDGSKDKTVQLVQEQWVKKFGTDLIRVNKLKQNVGKGGAVRRGMLVARGEYILMVDADGATKFSDLNKLESSIHDIQKNGEGVVVGSRAQYHEEESESERRPWYRNISHLVFAALVHNLCIKGIKDTQCGFKLFTRKSARDIFLSLHIERWAFDVEVLYIAQRLNHPISEVIVQWEEIDGSHLSVISASLQMFKDIMRVPILYRLGFWKFGN